MRLGAAARAKVGRGRQLWTVENLTSAPFLLTLSTALLCCLGLLVVFSASSIEAVDDGATAWSNFVSQAIYMVVATLACVFVRTVGASTFVRNRLWFLALWIAVAVLLVLVLVMGTDSHGAVRWIRVGPVSVQPSEFAKIVLVMSAARILAGWECREYSWRRAIVYLVCFVGVQLVLIYLQKDLGTLLIICSSIYLMAILAGVRKRLLIGLAAVAVVGVLVLVQAESYRGARFAIWLDPYSDYYGDGWQPIHALYAFASGGFFGLGIGNSRQKYSYLPEAQNDYAFAVIGEELGFLGTAGVVLLFVLWGWSALRIAHRIGGRDRVTALMVAGLALSVEIQALLNMGGTTGLIPMSGRTLPFISAGGSSILSLLIMVGLMLGAAREQDAAEAEQRVRSERMGAPAPAPRPQLAVIEGGAGSSSGAGGAREPRGGRRAAGASGSAAPRPAPAAVPLPEADGDHPASTPAVERVRRGGGGPARPELRPISWPVPRTPRPRRDEGDSRNGRRS